MSKEDPKKDQQPPNPNPKPNPIPSETLSLIKKGDYTIHILIEEIKNAHCKDPNQLPSPCIKMSCFNQSQRTSKLHQKCQDYSFNEHFYFSQTDLTIEELDKTIIRIEAYDYDNTHQQDYFGIYEFDISTIYSYPNHTTQNIWIALANPNGIDIERVNGFLKLSISVLNDNDPRVELSPLSTANNECLVPPQIKLLFKQLSIHIFKGEEISDESDTNKKVNKKCNGYIEAKYMGVTRSTAIVDMKNDLITWNEVIDFPVTLPAVGKSISFCLIDNDMIGTNIIGSFDIKLDDIFAGKYSMFNYVNVYGSPIHSKGKQYEDMNSNANVGSKWKGRILIKIDHVDTQKPVNGVRKINDEELLKQADKVVRNTMWTLNIRLYDLFYLPSEKDVYGVKISMQENEKVFGIKKANQGDIAYDLCGAIQCFTITKNIEEIPDIFIYLLNDKQKAICFQRLKAKNFHLNSKAMIIKLIPDPCIGVIQSNCIRSGLAKVKMLLMNKGSDKIDMNLLKEFTLEDDEDDLEKINDPKPSSSLQQVNLKPYTIYANVYMSRYLISGDSDGGSDLFVELSYGNQARRTSIKSNCINGVWNQSLKFDQILLDITNVSTWPIFFLKIMDSDLINDDFLAYNYIWLSDTSNVINSTKPPKAKWHQLRLPQSNRPQGQILMSFFILDSTSSPPQINIMPELTNYAFEINILGLRDLKPLSIIPIKKAFVSFDLNSINFDEVKSDLPYYNTEPGDSGSNPNISAVTKFDCKMPTDFTFIPYLQCEVFDYILAGLFQQNIGMFEIDLNKIIAATTKGIESDLKRIENEGRGNEFNENEEEEEGIELMKNDSRRDYTSNQPLNRNESSKKRVKLEDGNRLDVPLVEKEEHGNVEGLDMIMNDYNRERISQEIIDKQPFNSDYFVLKPVFEKYSLPGHIKGNKGYQEFLIENNSTIPDSKTYYPLGFIKYTTTDNGSILNNEGGNQKHYRRVFGQELEKVPELGLASPFIKATIRREKNEDNKSKNAFIEAITSEDNKILKTYSDNKQDQGSLDSNDNDTDNRLESRSYGTFKAIARICNKTTMTNYNNAISSLKINTPHLLNELKYYQKFENISQKMLTRKAILIRLYIINLANLEKRDLFSDPDPYIKISIGDQEKVNEKQNSLSDKKQCDWLKMYDIPTELPGNGALKISVYDYDPLFADELIGMTSIDLEDRYFDPEWNKLKYKPIEVRSLNHPDYKQRQGTIGLFMELIERTDRNSVNLVWNIQPQPVNTIEMRLIIWETEDIALSQDEEELRDIYIVAYLDNDKPQSTDVHYRCQTGNASFNWRMVIPITMPRTTNGNSKTVSFQVYDNDLLSKDDFLCSGSLDIETMLRDCNILDVPVVFDQKYYKGMKERTRKPIVTFLPKSEDLTGNKFWVDMKKNGQNQGRVLCSLELVPMWKAKSGLVGKGRNEPNVNPYLPPPFGRISFSLNPWTMMNQLMGPKLRRKCCQICCCFLVLLYLIIFLPALLYYVSGELINPFNYFR